MSSDNSGTKPGAPRHDYSCLTWNIEGFSCSKYALHSFLNLHSPDFVFIAEPMLFQCDIDIEMGLFKGDYNSYLCSEDLLDPELPLIKERAKGGTMALWKK